MARTTEKAKRRAKKNTRGKDAIRMANETMKYFAANPLKNGKKAKLDPPSSAS